MKTLLIMRHAKSSWDSDATSDHDRPLNPRGIRTAPMMARWLVKNDCIPDMIVSSTATRAKMTAELVVEHAGFSCEWVTEKRLYHSSPNELAEVASEVDNEVQSLMLVAHNPGMQQLVSTFAQDYRDFPTAAIAIIELDIEEWFQFQASSRGVLKELWLPKQLPVFE